MSSLPLSGRTSDATHQALQDGHALKFKADHLSGAPLAPGANCACLHRPPEAAKSPPQTPDEAGSEAKFIRSNAIIRPH